MKIDIEGLGRQPLLRRRIPAQVAKALTRLQAEPASVLVNFTDLNGPKGGLDHRCGITVRLPRRPVIHVENLARTEAVAFAGAADALETVLRKQGERELEVRRRPKKYYVARELLRGQLPPLTHPSRRRARRSAS